MAWKRNLFEGDNLEILCDMEENSIDLVYLDPPFNTGKRYSGKDGTEAEGVTFIDSFDWTNVIDAHFISLQLRSYSLGTLIELIRSSINEKTAAYLTMLAVRMFEVDRILKRTGSVYLHCDITSSHILRMMMDTIFGRRNFRNEIVWCYPPTGTGPKLGFHKRHDTLLFYGQFPNEGVFNRQYLERTEEQKKSFFRTDEDDRRYYAYTLPNGTHRRVYDDETQGYPVPSYWTDIPRIASGSKERTGYPTQKPLKLLDRIIRASSNEGEIILDPFCGCGTSIVAAEQLSRQWIGIDSNKTAIKITTKRLQDEPEFFFAKGEIVYAQKTYISDRTKITGNGPKF